MVAVVLLYRIATKITLIHSPENAMMTVEERKKMVGESPPSEFSENLAGRFTTAEAAALGRRFAELDRRLAADARQVELIFTRFGGERVKVMRPVFAQIVWDLNSRVPSADGCDYKTLQCIRRLPSVPEYGSHTTGHRPPRF